jgi:hypothetical protein
MSVAQTSAAGWYCSGAWPCAAGDQLFYNTSLAADGSVKVPSFGAHVNGTPAPAKGSIFTSTVTTGLAGSASVPVVVE